MRRGLDCWQPAIDRRRCLPHTPFAAVKRNWTTMSRRPPSFHIIFTILLLSAVSCWCHMRHMRRYGRQCKAKKKREIHVMKFKQDSNVGWSYKTCPKKESNVVRLSSKPKGQMKSAMRSMGNEISSQARKIIYKRFLFSHHTHTLSRAHTCSVHFGCLMVNEAADSKWHSTKCIVESHEMFRGSEEHWP